MINARETRKRRPAAAQSPPVISRDLATRRATARSLELTRRLRINTRSPLGYASVQIARRRWPPQKESPRFDKVEAQGECQRMLISEPVKAIICHFACNRGTANICRFNDSARSLRRVPPHPLMVMALGRCSEHTSNSTLSHLDHY